MKMHYRDLLSIANAYEIRSADIDAAEAVGDLDLPPPEGQEDWTDDEFESLCKAIIRILSGFVPENDYEDSTDCFDIVFAINDMLRRDRTHTGGGVTMAEVLDGSKDDAIDDAIRQRLGN